MQTNLLTIPKDIAKAINMISLIQTLCLFTMSDVLFMCVDQQLHVN